MAQTAQKLKDTALATAELEGKILELLDQAVILRRAAAVLREHNDAATAQYLQGKAVSLRDAALQMRQDT